MEPNDPRLTFGRFLAEVGPRFGPRRAVVFEGRALAYRELEREARLLARALIGAGVVKGARVAVHMGNRPEWIVAAFAVGMLGGVLVPVNTFASRSELKYVLRHSDASVLLMQPGLQKHRFLEDLLAEYPAIALGAPGRLRCLDLPQLRRVACIGIDAPRGGVETWGQLLAHEQGVSDELLDAAISEVEPADDGVLIYTSGTTAQPKGVLHTQRAAILQSWRFAEILRLEPDDRVYTTYPFFWTAGIAMSIGPTFAVGATLLLQEVFEPGAALEMIEAERATAVHAWPHQQKALGEHPIGGGARPAQRAQGRLQRADREAGRASRRTSTAPEPPTASPRPSRSPPCFPPTRRSSCASGPAAARSRAWRCASSIPCRARSSRSAAPARSP